MNRIRPVSDLHNYFEDVSKVVHETQEPIFLTKDGYGDMVIMSMDAYENLQFESEVYFKLREAEKQAAISNKRFSSKEVFQSLMETVQG